MHGMATCRHCGEPIWMGRDSETREQIWLHIANIDGRQKFVATCFDGSTPEPLLQ